MFLRKLKVYFQNRIQVSIKCLIVKCYLFLINFIKIKTEKDYQKLKYGLSIPLRVKKFEIIISSLSLSPTFLLSKTKVNKLLRVS